MAYFRYQTRIMDMGLGAKGRSVLAGLALLMVVLGGCKKENDPVPGPGGGGGQSAASNSFTSFRIGFLDHGSYANNVCLNGTELTITCRPSMLTRLRFVIPNFTGPGTYLMGPEVTASYAAQRNTPAGEYFNLGPDSSGFVEITSFNAAGLRGSFAGDLSAQGNTIQLTDGVFDGIRTSCALPDSFLVYSVGVLPANGPFGPWTDNRDVQDYYSYSRTDSTVSVACFNSANITTIGPYNTFQLVLPRHLGEGTYTGPDLPSFSTFRVSYSTPFASYSMASNVANELRITMHDTQRRYMKGSVDVAMSSGLHATAHFDLDY